MSLPPAFAVSALYDSFLQQALRRFFDRATFETEPIPSASSDGRLAIEPTRDPCALMVRWFGTRHVLRVAAKRPFTRHETRFARAIGAVLAARYRAILSPSVMAERGELFRGAIEDRYVGAFLDESSYAIQAQESRADRVASAIEVLRVAALSSYENRPISTGVLMLGTSDDPTRTRRQGAAGGHSYSQALTAIKSFYRLADGLHTVFLVSRDGALLDIIDVERWASEADPGAMPQAPCAKPYQAHARATLRDGHVCLVLSPSHDMKVFAEGAQILTFRNANWHLLDLEAKYEVWAEAVGSRPLALKLFQSALDLADAREGALFVVVRDPANAVPQLVAAADRLNGPAPGSAAGAAPSRRDLLGMLTGRTVIELDSSVLEALASLDGATVTDRSGRLLAVGAILRHPPTVEQGPVVEGARTTAAIAASRFGPVLKVSEDGIITFFDGEQIWDI